MPSPTIPPVPIAPTRTLPPGIVIQIYRDAIHGANDQAKELALYKALDELKALGIAGIAAHGFTGELDPAAFTKFATPVVARGMRCYAAFGIGSSNPIGKGQWLARVANTEHCSGVLVDAEGAWEDEASDKPSAQAMAEAYRKDAPNALTLDQPWFAPQVHWSKFPWEQFASMVDMRAPQVYVNNFMGQYGKQRYAKVNAWYARDWKVLETRLTTAQALPPAAPGTSLVKPRIRTIQGYKWELSDLVDCLLRNPAIIIWCEPFPDAVTMRAFRIVQTLAAKGFVGPEAVEAFQAANHLVVDGIVGPKTLAALGV